jgi:hypothetical protein
MGLLRQSETGTSLAEATAQKQARKKIREFKRKKKRESGCAGYVLSDFLQRLMEYITRRQGTATTLRGNSQTISQLAHTTAAILHGITNLAIGNSAADANVHDRQVPTG